MDADLLLVIPLIVLGWWYEPTRPACCAGVIVVCSANFIRNLYYAVKFRQAIRNRSDDDDDEL